MDTLVYTSSLFLIPINIACYKKKYILMNIYILLCLSSWAHHSCIHTNTNTNANVNISNTIDIDSEHTIYDDFDKIMCYYAIYYTFTYTLTFASPIQFLMYITCLCIVFYSYYHVNNNKNYYKRGLINYHLHKYHILMHIAACIGFIIILF